MSDSKTIECKPSQWFKIRAVAILFMLTFFSLWFFKDGYWGYRDKNVEVVMKQLFLGENEEASKNVDFAVKAVDEFKKKDYTREAWAEYASAQVVPTPADKDLLPRDFDYTTRWPEEIVNGYDELKEGNSFMLWKAYSGRVSMPLEPSEKLFDSGTIGEQYIVCGVCVLFLFYAAFICIRIMGRKMMVTATGYSPPGGDEIPYSAMRKIDKRKWANKGLAMIYYEDDGVTKKAKVDGMVYGQFKKEDGEPAEVLFGQIMDHFKGEVIEFVDDDEGEEGDEDVSQETEKEGGA